MISPNPFIKILAMVFALIVCCMMMLAFCTQRSASTTLEHQQSSTDLNMADDQASKDSSLETLKTLTAKITALEEQSQEMINQNQVLSQQDKTSLAQFKDEVLAVVREQIESFKAESKRLIAEEADHHELSDTAHAKNQSFKEQEHGNQEEHKNAKEKENEKESKNDKHKETKNYYPQDLNIRNQEESSMAVSSSFDFSPSVDMSTAGSSTAGMPTAGENEQSAIPYYTIPVNATLTGAIAMQPLIGRIPISGKVPDPYTFKIIIGPKNLSANGIDIPEELQGIVASGIAEGDVLGRCARGDIRSMTFVFADGRISTTEAKEGQVLGTIAAANGNPCIQGEFHTDAGLFLAGSAGFAGLQGYSHAFSQSQLHTEKNTGGESLAALISNAHRFAAGEGLSATAEAAQKWWEQRVESSFDFVYVPHMDSKTGKQLKLNINITQEIAIDYDLNKRKVFYAHDKKQRPSTLD